MSKLLETYFSESFFCWVYLCRLLILWQGLETVLYDNLSNVHFTLQMGGLSIDILGLLSIVHLDDHPSKYLVTPIYKPFRPFGRGQPQ